MHFPDLMSKNARVGLLCMAYLWLCCAAFSISKRSVSFRLFHTVLILSFVGNSAGLQNLLAMRSLQSSETLGSATYGVQWHSQHISMYREGWKF